MAYDLNKTVDHARTLSKQLKAVMEIADILDEVKNLDQFVSEAKVRATAAKESRDEAVSMMEEAKLRLENLITQQKTAEQQAQRISINAEVSRQTITDKAEADRKAVMLEVNKVATAVKEQIERDKASHIVNMNKWREEEQRLKHSLEEYKTALADIKQRIG